MFTAGGVRNNYLYLKLNLAEGCLAKIYINNAKITYGQYTLDGESGRPVPCNADKSDFWLSGDYRFPLDDGIHRLKLQISDLTGDLTDDIPVVRLVIRNSFECVIFKPENGKLIKVRPDVYFERETNALYANDKTPVNVNAVKLKSKDEPDEKNTEDEFEDDYLYNGIGSSVGGTREQYFKKSGKAVSGREKVIYDAEKFAINESNRKAKLIKLGIDETITFNRLFEMVQQKIPEAQYALAKRLDGDNDNAGAVKDKTEKIKSLLLKSAESGYGPAEFDYAFKIVDDNPKAAAEYIVLSAETGYLPAQIEYMRMCFGGTDSDALGTSFDFSIRKGVYLYEIITERNGEISENDTMFYEAALIQVDHEDRSKALDKKNKKGRDEEVIQEIPRLKCGIGEIILIVCIAVVAAMTVGMLTLTSGNILGIEMSGQETNLLWIVVLIPELILIICLSNMKKSKAGKIAVVIALVFVTFFAVYVFAVRPAFTHENIPETLITDTPAVETAESPQ